MQLSEIYIRDPFILPCDGSYYMYGKVAEDDREFVVYTSKDLLNWSEPRAVFTRGSDFWGTKDYWAPEVHQFRGKFYMFASFKSEDMCRGTHILVSTCPTGSFAPVSPLPVTPLDWECLDGTLYIDKQNNPYLVFSHEWLQIGNGTVCRVRLNDDLSSIIGEPEVMFSALDFDFVKPLCEDRESFVTDGPFLFRAGNDDLLMIWSSFCKPHGQGYFVNVLKSNNGEINGRWEPQNMLFDEHGGHGMIFRTFEGTLKLALHRPNSPAGKERPCLIDVYESEGSLRTYADNN